MILDNTIEIYVQLLADEEGTFRPTQAIDLGNGTFRVLPTHNYDRADEVWEFPPGSIVKCKKKMGIHGEYLRAVEKAE